MISFPIVYFPFYLLTNDVEVIQTNKQSRYFIDGFFLERSVLEPSVLQLNSDWGLSKFATKLKYPIPGYFTVTLDILIASFLILSLFPWTHIFFLLDLLSEFTSGYKTIKSAKVKLIQILRCFKCFMIIQTVCIKLTTTIKNQCLT